MRADDLIRSARAARAAYERQMQRADLDMAIDDYEALLEELTEDHPDFPAHANALCEAYHLLAQHTGSFMHSPQALSLATRTLDGISPSNRYRLDCLYSVGVAYAGLLFASNGCPEAATAGIQHLDEAIRLASGRHPKLAILLSTRASIFDILARRSVGEERITQANESASNYSAALAQAVSVDDRAHVLEGYSSMLLFVGSLMPSKWRQLDKAISLAEEGFHLLHPPDHRIPRFLNLLGLALQMRWRSNPSLHANDLRRAQKYLHMAADIFPSDNFWWLTCCLNEAETRIDLFETYGVLDDLQTGLASFRGLMKKLPPDHSHFYNRAGYLGNALYMAFRNLGQSGLLDEAIDYHHLAVQHAPHATAWKYRRQLGNVLVERYAHQGDSLALDSAIKVLERGRREAGLPHESRRLSADLGRALTTRYLAHGRTEDLDRAIESIRQITASPQLAETPDLPGAHAAYGQAMLARFLQSGSIQMLYHATESFRTAIAFQGTAQGSTAEYYHQLSEVERLIFLVTRCVHNLDMSIESSRKSLSFTAEGDPLTARHRCGLALSLIARFEIAHIPSDFVDACVLLETASTHIQSFVKHRWMAARERARLLHQDQPEGALASYVLAVSLLPRVAWLGLEEHVRYETAQTWLSLGNDAAACALAQWRPDVAIELLESSRSVLWNQQLQLGQVPEGDLQAVPAELLAELHSVGRALEASLSNTVFEGSSRDADKLKQLEQESRSRRRLAERWEELVAQIRTLPGAQNFLHQTKYSELQQSAASGPVVVINISQYRSDGIIIFADVPPRVFPLRNASPQVINLHAGHLVRALLQTKDWHGLAFAEGQVSQLLQTLWTTVGEDMCLALQPFLPEGRLSRVWLMPTGALAALPLHAAMCGGPQPIGLMDVMISSYTPTLSALIRAQQRLTTKQTGRAKMLAIGCSKIARERALPSWTDEKDILAHTFPECDLTILEDEAATSEHVLQHVKNHNFVHITSHGHHDWINPYRSHLVLHDGPLTLRKLAQQKLDHADFAFLSACHTARIDPRAPDESINLASGLNLAGFSSIIGTLWGIADCDAADVSEVVYAHLRRGGRIPDPAEAAGALHEAVQRLRYRGVPVIRWAPFIHIGI